MRPRESEVRICAGQPLPWREGMLQDRREQTGNIVARLRTARLFTLFPFTQQPLQVHRLAGLPAEAWGTSGGYDSRSSWSYFAVARPEERGDRLRTRAGADLRVFSLTSPRYLAVPPITLPPHRHRLPTTSLPITLRHPPRTTPDGTHAMRKNNPVPPITLRMAPRTQGWGAGGTDALATRRTERGDGQAEGGYEDNRPIRDGVCCVTAVARCNARAEALLRQPLPGEWGGGDSGWFWLACGPQAIDQRRHWCVPGETPRGRPKGPCHRTRWRCV